MVADSLFTAPPPDMHTGATPYGASAPGRLDVMGGISDYSGGLVLQMPIAERTHVTLSLRKDGRFRVASGAAGAGFGYFEVYADDLCLNGKPDIQAAKRYFAQQPDRSWLAYVVGCFVLANLRYGVPFGGADVTVRSEVPVGKGLSSSAALEVATLRALLAATNKQPEGTELARLAQEVENLVVGAPCGLMDQLASQHGRPGHLLPIICRPDVLLEPIPVPEDVIFRPIDSGVRHAVTGADYGQVRTAAFMGYSIVAAALGVPVERLAEARQTCKAEGLPYGGYLAAISVSEWMRRFSRLMPDTLSGADFIARYRQPIDPLSLVDPTITYHIAACASHPVYENQRCGLFRTILTTLPDDAAGREEALNLLGELMLQSHRSYSACGLGHPATDAIVDAPAIPGAPKRYGAKITGGGSGGTVCVLERV